MNARLGHAVLQLDSHTCYSPEAENIVFSIDALERIRIGISPYSTGTLGGDGICSSDCLHSTRLSSTLERFGFLYDATLGLAQLGTTTC